MHGDLPSEAVSKVILGNGVASLSTNRCIQFRFKSLIYSCTSNIHVHHGSQLCKLKAHACREISVKRADEYNVMFVYVYSVWCTTENHLEERAGLEQRMRATPKPLDYVPGWNHTGPSPVVIDSGTGWPSTWQPLGRKYPCRVESSARSNANIYVLPVTRRTLAMRSKRWPASKGILLLHEVSRAPVCDYRNRSLQETCAHVARMAIDAEPFRKNIRRHGINRAFANTSSMRVSSAKDPTALHLWGKKR